MIYTDFQGKSLSLLGFGAMRLPTLEGGAIDEQQVSEMIGYAMEHGVNYFDTAYPYHGGKSEIVVGHALSAYPRDSFYLATKYPGHQIASSYDPKGVFEEQLEKCGVDYFDFYLLHNVYEQSMETYLDPQWGILEYFKEQRRKGRIRHLGFSTHASVDTLKAFLDICGEDMEFCQIQLNWVDWTLQQAKEKVELLAKYNIPVWVMEPVRGGRLSKLAEKDEARLTAMRPGESMTAWGLRFLQGIPNVQMILSGMSSMAQMTENVQTFENAGALTGDQIEALFEIAEEMKDSIPCTACRYCTEHCPMGLDIPLMLSAYNDIRFVATTNSILRIEALPDDKQPSACLGCGECAKMCPQKIDIPAQLRAFSEKLKTIPSWKEICRQREEAAKKLRGEA